MHIEYINKKIELENIVNDINLINIEDNIQYLNRNDGILIKGYIDIECEYVSLGIVKEFNDRAIVSILVPYENINSNELFFKLDDFDYSLKDNIIFLTFKIEIEGYKEIEKTFQDENNEMEILSDENIDIDKVKEYINSNDEIIEIDDPNTLILDTKEELSNPITEIETKDDSLYEHDEGKRLEFNISGSLINDNNKNNNTSLFSTLFKKEKHIKMYKYRIILEDDTYEEIAKEYNINLFKLKEINNNMNLSIGQMIKIPNKNE